MKGLLYKNALITFRQMWTLVLVFFVFLVMGLQSGHGGWAVYAVVMLSMFAGASIRTDETTKWNQYCELLPISRKTVVASIYAGSYGMLVLGVLLYMLLRAVICLRFDGLWDELLMTAALMLVTSFLMTAITTPLVLKFGVQKAPVIQMIVAGMAAGSGMILFGEEESLPRVLSGISGPAAAGGAVLFTLAAVFLSWIISVRIYEHREIA